MNQNFTPMTQLTPEQQLEIFLLFKNKISGSEIARKMGLSISSVNRLISRTKKNGKLGRKKGSGRVKKISPAQKALILKEICTNPKISLRKIEKKLTSATGSKVSYNTIRTCLIDNGIKCFSPIKKPLLRPVHIQKRFSVSRELIKMPESKVKAIIFSDESKFNLFYSDGNQYVWRKPGTGLETRHLEKTIKGNGGSVMVWACFSYHGVGNICIIDQTMTGPVYVDVLSRNLFESVAKMKLNSFIFQQDNDPKHTSRIAKEFFIENNIEVVDWPAQSPDLNPIEHLWAYVKLKIAERMPKNLAELKRFIIEEWNNIPMETCQKYALSFKNRALAIFKAAGNHTYY